MSFFTRCRSQWPNAPSARWMWTWFGAVLVAGCLAVGCGGDSSDNGAQQDFGTAQLRLEATSSVGNMSNQIEFQDMSGTLYTLKSLRINVEEIELDLPENVSCADFSAGEFSERLECDDDDPVGGEDQLKIDGPIVFDMLEGTTVPQVLPLEIPAVAYQEVDLEVDTARIEDQTVSREDEIIDRTVVALADFEFASSKRELKLDFSFKAEAKAGNNDPSSLDLQPGDTLVLRLDVANWLRSIPVTECLMSGSLKAQNGVVVLDDETIDACADAEAQFESNFEDSLRVEIVPPSQTQ